MYFYISDLTIGICRITVNSCWQEPLHEVNLRHVRKMSKPHLMRDLIDHIPSPTTLCDKGCIFYKSLSPARRTHTEEQFFEHERKSSSWLTPSIPVAETAAKWIYAMFEKWASCIRCVVWSITFLPRPLSATKGVFFTKVCPLRAKHTLKNNSLNMGENPVPGSRRQFLAETAAKWIYSMFEKWASQIRFWANSEGKVNLCKDVTPKSACVCSF